MSEYFARVESKPGLNTLPHNPCRLLDFQLLVLPAGETYTGQTGQREVLAVILGGKATFDAAGNRFKGVGRRANVFAGKPHSVYLPRGMSYSIRAESAVEIGLCSAPSDREAEPYVIEPERVNTGVWGAANFSRNFREILTATQQPDLPAERLIVGETLTPSGNWSTYPPHKHEQDQAGEAFHEEMYFFRVNTPEGFGILRHYDREGWEENYTVRNNTILMAPRGYHTYVGAPGYTSYYLWMLAGHHRNQGVMADPDLAWVGKAVPMLQDLGH
jgi:5-deoxy-glucuronate isomerase